MFYGDEYRLLKNKDGYYKIQINQAGYWRDITHNDTALSICGKGQPETQIFFSRTEAGEFLRKYFLQKPPVKDHEKITGIDQNWETIEE